jgi:amino acid permease
LQAAYTLTGYGLVASMCEEVQNPAREVPKAMVMSVVAAGFTGLLYLIPILFVLPDVRTLLAASAGQPITVLFKMVTGSAAGGFGLLFLILGIQIFAGTGALTASSRCTYAFARDGAIPGSRLWSQTNQRLGVPLWGLVLSTVRQHGGIQLVHRCCDHLPFVRLWSTDSGLCLETSRIAARLDFLAGSLRIHDQHCVLGLDCSGCCLILHAR